MDHIAGQKQVDVVPLDIKAVTVHAPHMNPLYATTKQGTIGELIVQLRLLEYDVQAAAPIKDSGNDLIAIRCDVFRAIQVRSSTRGRIVKPKKRVSYDILAVVKLLKKDGRFIIKEAEIFFFSKDDVEKISGNVSKYPKNLLNQEVIEQFFHKQ